MTLVLSTDMIYLHTQASRHQVYGKAEEGGGTTAQHTASIRRPFSPVIGKSKDTLQLQFERSRQLPARPDVLASSSGGFVHVPPPAGCHAVTAGTCTQLI